jgi:signal transduction histidine kinase
VQDGDEQHATTAAEIDEFMSVAAHDLRNPIAVVRASAQMAQRQIARGDAEGAQGRLKAIVEQTDRLTDTLETFLDAARVTSGRMPRRRDRTDLLELVQAASERARFLVGDHGKRQMEYLVPEGCIGTWEGQSVERAIRALVANAMLYGDPAAPVRIEAVRNGHNVTLTVSGGGPGPDADEADHLFERFYRGPSAANAGQSGSGLGLFTARGIARAHGGDLRRLEGDRFQMELPLAD